MIYLFGSIKEYKIFEITKKTLSKSKWSFEEFESNVSGELFGVLDNGGFVFALGRKQEKNKIVKGIYVFKLEENNGDKNLIFSKSLFSEEIREEVLIKFVEHLDSVLGSLVSEKHVSSVIFNEKKFIPKNIKIGKKEVSVMILWLLWGLITSILTKDVIWLCLGVCFGTTTSYTLEVNGVEQKTQKKQRKKEKKKIK